MYFWNLGAMEVFLVGGCHFKKVKPCQFQVMYITWQFYLRYPDKKNQLEDGIFKIRLWKFQVMYHGKKYSSDHGNFISNTIGKIFFTMLFFLASGAKENFRPTIFSLGHGTSAIQTMSILVRPWQFTVAWHLFVHHFKFVTCNIIYMMQHGIILDHDISYHFYTMAISIYVI